MFSFFRSLCGSKASAEPQKKADQKSQQPQVALAKDLGAKFIQQEKAVDVKQAVEYKNVPCKKMYYLKWCSIAEYKALCEQKELNADFIFERVPVSSTSSTYITGTPDLAAARSRAHPNVQTYYPMNPLFIAIVCVEVPENIIKTTNENNNPEVAAFMKYRFDKDSLQLSNIVSITSASGKALFEREGVALSRTQYEPQFHLEFGRIMSW